MNLLAGGLAAFKLMGVADFGGKLRIVGDALLAVFGVGRNFWDFLLTFAVALLQGVLVGLVVIVWRARKKELQRSAEKRADENFAVTDDLQRTGIAAGLAVLGAGCPTCGTTLLAPLIGAVSSSGGLALAGTLSGVLTALSIVIALVALRKIGKEAFVELTRSNSKRRRSAKSEFEMKKQAQKGEK